MARPVTPQPGHAWPGKSCPALSLTVPLIDGSVMPSIACCGCRAGEGSPLVPLDHANWEEDLAVYQDQCDHSRQVAAARAFDDCGTWRGKQVSMRSVYLHMIQEYARHNGHADMIRELLDGATGL